MSDTAARRFYKEAAAVSVDGTFGVQLDGRAVKTPLGAALALPNQQLADAIAAEWQAQDKVIEPASMPTMQLACTALDRVAGNRDTVLAETAAYGGSDLLCYRADAPADLVDLQQTQWQPILDWLARTHGARLEVTAGIVHVAQTAEALDALRGALAAYGDFPLTSIVRLTQVFGSLALALAVGGGHLTWQDAMKAALLDEVYQAEKWGEDREALERQRYLTAEAEQAAAFLSLCGE